MAPESVTLDRSASIASRIETASASIDGIAAILQDMVSSEDLQASRKAYSCADLLERISDELDHLAVQARVLSVGAANALHGVTEGK